MILSILKLSMIDWLLMIDSSITNIGWLFYWYWLYVIWPNAWCARRFLKPLFDNLVELLPDWLLVVIDMDFLCAYSEWVIATDSTSMGPIYYFVFCYRISPENFWKCKPKCVRLRLWPVNCWDAIFGQVFLFSVVFG
jgi:hypothetical protein